MTTPVPSFAPSSRYRLLERIAVGGMGEIFLGHDTVLDRRVVIKYLLDVAYADDDRVAMFLDEARAVARCDHTNVVKIFDIGVDRERYFMALEHLEGWDLAEVSKRATGLRRLVPVPIVVRLMMDAALGLHAAHEARAADGRPLELVHRDVTPRNLFVVRDGVLKLLDFGIAKSNLQRAATEVGMVKGTLAYMSPEQCTSRPMDRRSDVFALGVILHELLAGERLFRRKDAEGMMLAIVGEPIPPPHRPGGVAGSVVAVASRSLERSPEMRFPTALAFAEALERAAGGEGPASREAVSDYLRGIFLDATDVETPESLAPHPATRAHAISDELLAKLPQPGQTAPTLELGASPVRAVVPPRPRKRAWWLAFAGFAATIGIALGIGWLVHHDRPGAMEVQATAPAPPAPPALAPAPSPALHEEPIFAETPNPPVRQSGRHEARPKTKAASVAQNGPATLTVQSEPWANVYIDGVLVGPSPLIEHALNAGRVRIRLVNPDLALERSTTVDVKPGKVTRMRFDLRKGVTHVLP
ncbi:MAG: serine/threonine-protein kinase [Myxococcota bacterium]